MSSSTRVLPVLAPVRTGADYVLDIDAYIKDSYPDVSQAMEELPAIIEWLNEQRQIMKERMLIQKHTVKAVEGRVYFELRAGMFAEQYPLKMTESALEYAIPLDPRVEEAHRNLAVLIGHTERLTNSIMSLQLKLDMVRSTEATRRALELGSDKNDEETM